MQSANDEVELQETSFNYDENQNQEQHSDEKETAPIIETKTRHEETKHDSCGFWCIVIFFSLIFCLICAFVLHQKNIQANQKIQQHQFKGKSEQPIFQKPFQKNDEEKNQNPQINEITEKTNTDENTSEKSEESTQQSTQENINDEYISDEPYKIGQETIQMYDLVKLNSKTALCLDGTPGSYYESKLGDPSRILLHFQGGAWCFGDNQQSTYEDCSRRSTSVLGSSRGLSQARFLSNSVLSRHPENEFRNWKKIYLNYCDGTGHQGSKKDPVSINNQQIYFRGHNITAQIFDQLERKFGMYTKAKKIVIGGFSAGGLAAFTWANYLADKVQFGKVYMISDSGVFYDSEGLTRKTHTFRNLMANMMKVSNAQIDPPTPECIKENQNQKENCMFAQHLYKHIKVPMFVANSLYDSYSVWSIINANCQKFNQCADQSSQQAIEENRKNITSILTEIGSKKGNGVFGISCGLHGLMEYDRYVSTRYTVPSNSNCTVAKAVSEWFKNINGNHTHIDLEPYPSNKGCS